MSAVLILEGVKLQWLGDKKLVLLRNWEEGSNSYVIIHL